MLMHAHLADLNSKRFETVIIFRSSVQAQLKRKQPDSGGDESNSSSNGDDAATVTNPTKTLRHELDDHVTDTVGVVVMDGFVLKAYFRLNLNCLARPFQQDELALPA